MTDVSQGIAALSSDIHTTLLKPLGFRKHRNSFTRQLDGGLRQVVTIWGGPVWSGAYGGASIWVGVDAAEVPYGYAGKLPHAALLRISHSGTVAGPPYSGVEIHDTVARDVARARFEQFGYAWLTEMTTRDALLDAHRDRGPEASGINFRVDTALRLMETTGRRGEADTILRLAMTEAAEQWPTAKWGGEPDFDWRDRLLRQLWDAGLNDLAMLVAGNVPPSKKRP